MLPFVFAREFALQKVADSEPRTMLFRNVGREPQALPIGANYKNSSNVHP